MSSSGRQGARRGGGREEEEEEEGVRVGKRRRVRGRERRCCEG